MNNNQNQKQKQKQKKGPEGGEDPGRSKTPRGSREWEEIFQAIGHPAVILDPKHKILAANQAAIRLLGKSEEELLGRRCYEIFHQSDTPPPGCLLEQLISSGRLETQEMEMEALGGVFWMSCTPVVDAQGHLKRVIHLATDITSRKRLEEALEQREARLNSILRAAPVGIGLVTDRVIREVNDRLCQLTGYTPEELQGHSARLLYPTQEEYERVGQEKYRQIRESGSGTVETRWRRKDGSLIEVLLSSTPLVPGDLSKGVVFTALDLTTRKQAENTLKEREAFLNLIFTSIQDGLSILDADLTILRVNPAMQKWYAHARPLVGKKCYEAYHGRREPCPICPSLYTLETGRSGHKVVPRVDARGEISGWLDLYTYPLKDSQTGRVRGVIEYVKDITVRHRAEEALKESERRFREVLETVRLNAIMLDAEGDLIFANDFFLETTGWNREEILGENWFNTFLPPEEREEMWHIFQHYLERRHIPPYYEYWILTRWGERRLIAWNNTLRRDPQGKILGITSIGEDITRRRQAEEALRKSEERYRLLFEKAPIGIFHFDREGVIQDCNEIFVKIIGSSREKLVGFNMLTQVRDPGVIQALHEAFAGRVGYYEGDYSSDTADKVTPVRAHFSSLLSETGEFLGGVGLVEDLTLRRQAEEAFHLLVDRAPIGIFIVQEGRFKLVNPGFQRITGFTSEELLGREAIELVAPEFREQVQEAAIRMLKGQTTASYEYQALTKSGERRWIRETVVPSYFGGKRATLGYFMDITEAKRLEAQFLQAQKMEAVGLLAGGVAHDFNNLLTACTGYCDLLLSNIHQEDPLRIYGEEILKAVQRGESLTRQLLAFSRRQILQPEVLNLNEVIEQITGLLQRLIGEDIELITVLDPELGAVKVDPGQVEQIIMNLAVNARDAMPRGGQLIIETANFLADEDYVRTHMGVAPGNYVMLAVSDSGQGMDQQTLERIFEPFYTTKERGKGTGLGLATVYGIVKQSGGHIWVYSEPGAGTTFKIYLPRVEEEITRPVEKKPLSRTLQGSETILLAEDDEALRALFAESLRKYGYEVLAAAHGEEALSLCETYPRPVHLLVTDVVLPRMNGAILAMRLSMKYPNLKVLFMSGYTENAIVHNGVLDDSVDFLQKPFRITALLEKIREILDRPSEASRF
uniref:histidine kinase n=1 Tax=Desulfobacca acetoxidans TaxID=60893 RepID=A0A7C5EPD1_9BACT